MSKSKTSLKLRTSLLTATIFILVLVSAILLLVFGFGAPVSAPALAADTVTITHNHTKAAHTGDEERTSWKPLIESTSVTTRSGAYYLGSHVSGKKATLSGGNYYLSDWNGGTKEEAIKLSNIGATTIVITGNVTLCLNGYYITGTANDENFADGSVIEVSDGATLTLCDCQHDNSPGRVRQGKAEKGGGVHVKGGGTFNMYGGVIRACTAVRGGGVHVEEKGVFTLYGGRIRKNNVKNGKVGDTSTNGNGAGVYVATGGTFTMNGGDIFQNEAEFSGGGVFVAFSTSASSTSVSGKVIINEGQIGNNIALYGGGIACNRGTVEVTGGIIGGAVEGDATIDNSADTDTDEKKNMGNVATYRGGGIYNVAGTVKISKTALIKRNRVTTTDNNDDIGGGGIFTIQRVYEENGKVTKIEKGTLIVDGGLITENRSWRGGGVYAAAGGEFTMSNGNINGNFARFISTSPVGTGGGVFIKGGSFTMSGGTISNNAADQSGGGVYVFTDGTFIMTKGEISGNTAKAGSGGGVLVYGGSFTMSGGTVGGSTEYDANTATEKGGGVHVYSGSFTMSKDEGETSGGAVSYNKAASGGGVYSAGTFTMTSGTISNNTATAVKTGDNAYSGGMGGGVFINDGCTFEISNGTISDNKAIAIKQDEKNDKGEDVYTGGTGGGVQLGTNAKLIMSVGSSISNNTSARHGGGVYVYSKATLTMNDGTMSGNKALDGSGGAVCVASAGDIPGEVVIWKGTISGNTANDGGGLASLGNITVHDGTISGNIAKNGGGGVLIQDATLTLEKGSISDNKAGNGGGVYAWKKKGKFVMTGGTVNGNTATGDGGGVYVTSAAEFTLSGGVIGGSTEDDANKANNGGGVCINKTTEDDSTVLIGKFNMTVGTISGNTAVSDGGGVYVYSGAEFKMTGGTIGGTNTAEHGGGVHTNGKFDLTDEAVISDNAVTGNGGGVFVGDGEFTMSGGKIKSNAANSYGGGVIVGGNGIFKMSAGTIDGNGSNGQYSVANGGGVYVNGGAFEMSGGTIKNNAATTNGGGVYIILSATFKMSDGTIGDNTATNGGGVYVAGNSDAFKVSGGTVSGNKKSDDNTKNSNVFLAGSKKITVSEKVKAGTSIGITVPAGNEAYVFTSGYGGDYNKTAGVVPAPKQYFFGDNGECVRLTDGGEASAGHKLKEVAGVDPTCTDSGNIHYWHCEYEDCGKNFSDSTYTTEVSASKIVLDATGHHAAKTEPEVAATCTKDGHKAYVYCDRCEKYFTNDSYLVTMTEEEIVYKAPGHKFEIEIEDESYAATCTESGQTKYKCKNCDETKTVVITKLGHNITDHADYHDATCTKSGNEAYWYCDRCEKYFGDEGCNGEIGPKEITINAYGHDYAEPDEADWHWTADATSATATVTFTCQRDSSHSTNETATVTDFGGTTSCEEVGSKTYYAEIWFNDQHYESTKEVEVPASGHSWKAEWDTSWQQSGDGWGIKLYFVCQNDTLHIDYIFIDGEVTDETPSTCFTAGERVYKAVAVNPQGYTVELPDDAEYTDTLPLAPDNHEALEEEEAQAATCEEAGCAAYEHCDLCGYTTYSEIAARGHDWKITVDDSGMNKNYAAFDEIDLTGFKVILSCNNDTKNSHKFEYTAADLGIDNNSITYNSTTRLHYGDTSVKFSFSVQNSEYSYSENVQYTITGLEVALVAADVQWQYAVGALGSGDGQTLTDDMTFTYDPLDSYTVWVKFPAADLDDVRSADPDHDANSYCQGGYYYVEVGTFHNAKGYTFTLSEYGNYSIADSSRSITVNRLPFPVGGEQWLSGNNSVLMDGYVKQDGSEYKYYSVLTEGATYVKNAIVSYKNGTTVTVKYPDFDQTYPDVTEFYTVKCVNNTATASGMYTATATLKPTAYAIANADNYAIVAADNLPDGVTVSVDPDTGDVTVTKVWYAAISDNSFSGKIGDWTFGDTVTFNAAMSDIPTLEKGNDVATVKFVLERDGGQIGVKFDRSELSDYINVSMPFGRYTLLATVSDVTVDSIVYSGFEAKFTFTVSKATFTVSNINALQNISDIPYDGGLHINQEFTPTATIIKAGIGIWENYSNLYSDAVAITFSHANWTGTYRTAADIEALPSNTLFINAGTYTAQYRISARNYEYVEDSFTVEIIKKAYDLANVVFEDKTIEKYDGNYHSLDGVKELPTNVGVTAKVSYDDNTGKKNANENGYPVTATLTLSEADRVNYKFVNSNGDSDGNIQNDYTAVYTAKLIIKKATYDLDNVVFEDKTVPEYDGNYHSLDGVKGLPTNVGVNVGVTYDDNTGKRNANENGYPVTATLTLSETDRVNYKFVNSNGDSDGNIQNDYTAVYTAKLIIKKAKISLSLTFEDGTFTYDSEKSYSLAVKGSLSDKVQVSYDPTSVRNQGTHPVTATVSIRSAYVDNYEFADDCDFGENYEIVDGVVTMHATLTITAAKYPINVSFDRKEVTYTGKAYSLYISGTLPTGVTYSYENNNWVEVGTHTVTVHFYHNNPNYGSIDDMTQELVILPATYKLNVTFTDATVVYTGNAHSLSLRGTLPAGVTYTYENNSRTNVGTQMVTVKFKGDSKNYKAIPDMTAYLTVVPASVGIGNLSLEGKTLDYDGNVHNLAIDGALPDDVTVKYYVIIDGEEVEFDGAMEAGTYDVIARFELPDSENYKAIRPLNARLTILAAEIPTPPPVIVEPSATEVEMPIVFNENLDQQAAVVEGKIVHEDDFPYWIIVVCIIAAEVIAMAAMGCYMAFRSYKKKKR